MIISALSLRFVCFCYQVTNYTFNISILLVTSHMMQSTVYLTTRMSLDTSRNKINGNLEMAL
jgi:hypothetical protein